MSFVDLIIKKRDGGELTQGEIYDFVNAVTNNTVPDYQVSAMLMAMCINSLTEEETVNLTLAMAKSGEILDLSAVDGITVDKHSTGGVGDTTTLVLAPLTASLGLKVLKMSGRGLGHTGGTLDKLESIPGFNVSLTQEKAIAQVNDIGIAIMGQTSSLAPADKRLYALRDVTGTVESIPLIASSIMSKKIAAGTDVIVLDVKYGNGAFMKTLEDARQLARTMVDIGKSLNKKTAALITAMDRPLGMNVGNSLEVIEAVEILKGKRGGRLKDVALTLGAKMLELGGIAKADAFETLNRNIANGKGLEKLRELISAQGSNSAACDDYSLLPQAKEHFTLTSPTDGIVTAINTTDIGRASVATGAGRLVKDAAVDLGAGIIMHVTAGDKVKKGDVLAEIFAESGDKCRAAADIILSAVNISDRAANPLPLIAEVIE